MSQHQDTSASKNTKSTQKVSAPPMGIPDDEILDVVPLSVIPCKAIDLNQPIDASASACSNQGNSSSIPSGSTPTTNSKEDIHYTDHVIRNLVTRILNEGHYMKGVSTPLCQMHPSPEVEQHSGKDDDSSSFEKDLAAEGLCSLGKTVSEKGKSVASKTANASHSEKHDMIDLEDGSSNDQEESLLHHLKPSVAKRMKTRKGRSVAELMSSRKAKKNASIGPSKSWSKVEVKKRKVRDDSESEEDVKEDVPDISLVKKTTARKSPVKVPAVHLDNISFHLEHEAAKWKFVIQRRVAVERELGKDAADVKEVMDLIKVVGLLKTVAGFSQCELEVTNNKVCREITARQVKGWPVKKHLPAGKLTVKYAILHKIGAANWVPTNHISTIANTLGSHVEDIVMTSAMKKPASKVGTIVELKETCKELGEGIRVATARKQSLEALIASLEQAEGENIVNVNVSHEEEAEAHTSSERSANNDDISGNSVSGADEDASSSSTK
ncbi:uncharacterized protein LOC127095124 [Lathyrus oleraceus]|uniref:uncharacterized protein LOC127095124 n=1 Tax=Pisum sativum TaxID=3888 RepID=UPI0021D32EF4|nr:uncharacterized protein LOC127095124 [Pisum sativum]